MDDLIERLRALSRREHSDYSIGDEAADALEAAREDAWQTIETCPNDGCVVMFCDERQNIWTDSAWDRSSAATGFYATHWRPLPAPPAIDQARGKGGGG